jgi:hypothetical protein
MKLNVDRLLGHLSRLGVDADIGTWNEVLRLDGEADRVGAEVLAECQALSAEQLDLMNGGDAERLGDVRRRRRALAFGTAGACRVESGLRRARDEALGLALCATRKQVCARLDAVRSELRSLAGSTWPEAESSALTDQVARLCRRALALHRMLGHLRSEGERDGTPPGPRLNRSPDRFGIATPGNPAGTVGRTPGLSAGSGAAVREPACQGLFRALHPPARHRASVGGVQSLGPRQGTGEASTRVRARYTSPPLPGGGVQRRES